MSTDTEDESRSDSDDDADHRRHQNERKNNQKIFSDKNLHDQMSAKSLEIIRNHGIDVTIKKFEDIYRLVIDNKNK